MAHQCFLPEINADSLVKQYLCSDMYTFILTLKQVLLNERKISLGFSGMTIWEDEKNVEDDIKWAGGIILVGMIKNLFDNPSPLGFNEIFQETNNLAALDRYQYLTGEGGNTEFIERFITTNLNDSKGVGEYFFQLFKGSGGFDARKPTEKIRRHIEQATAVRQCERAIGENASSAMDQQEYCYLCSCRMQKGQQLECEHILPIKLVLQHLWIIQHTHHHDDKLLEVEYAWTHRCCNQVKNDEEFIYSGNLGNDYKMIINQKAINDFQKKLKKNIDGVGGGIACDEVKKESLECNFTVKNEIIPVVDLSKFDAIREVCDQNINSLKNYSMQHGFSPSHIGYLYELLIKFKVLSSFKSDETFFKEVLLGKPIEQYQTYGGEPKSVKNATMSNKNKSSAKLLSSSKVISEQNATMSNKNKSSAKLLSSSAEKKTINDKYLQDFNEKIMSILVNPKYNPTYNDILNEINSGKNKNKFKKSKKSKRFKKSKKSKKSKKL